MSKRCFLGMSAGYSTSEVWRHTFAMGRQKDCDKLASYLDKKYSGETFLCKNGRSALALALKAYFNPGDAVIVNGFTCYAVYEAVVSAGLVPIFADISNTNLNYDVSDLTSLVKREESSSQKGSKGPIRGIIVQNSLGYAVDIEEIETFAKKHNLVIIEDLAHCYGMKYADGREAGTVGVACALSFGKDKSIDTVSGGAVVLRGAPLHKIEAPSKTPKCSDHLRARFYPMLATICRGLMGIHLGGALMRGLVKIHWAERSADNRLDLQCKISKFEAKLALLQLQDSKRGKKMPLRRFCFVTDRDKVLQELQRAGYYFGGFWYEKPVSPTRYYSKVHFPEVECPKAVWVSKHIINLPTYYPKQLLDSAYKIIRQYEIDLSEADLQNTEIKVIKQSTKGRSDEKRGR